MPETPERLRAVERHLPALDWLGWERRDAAAASEAEIKLIHTPHHVEHIRDLAIAGRGTADAETWVGEASLEHVVIPAADQFDPDLILISAGYDAHIADPLADCRLQTTTFAEMARHTRDLADSAQAPVGAVLEGGYQPGVLGDCVAETLLALGGEDPATSAAPDAMLTSRAAARVGHFWEL